MLPTALVSDTPEKAKNIFITDGKAVFLEVENMKKRLTRVQMTAHFMTPGILPQKESFTCRLSVEEEIRTRTQALIKAGIDYNNDGIISPKEVIESIKQDFQKIGVPPLTIESPEEAMELIAVQTHILFLEFYPQVLTETCKASIKEQRERSKMI